MKEIRIASSFIASITSITGGFTARTTSASPTNLERSSIKATSVNEPSANLLSSPAPDCMCSFAPSLISLAVTEGTNATRRSYGCVSFRTATLTNIPESPMASKAAFERLPIWDSCFPSLCLCPDVRDHDHVGLHLDSQQTEAQWQSKQGRWSSSY